MTKETGMVVQKLRLQHGWSQEQLAALCALNVRTIQRIERGQPASAESLKALASVFEVEFLALKEPNMDQPSTATLRTEEALALARVRRIKGFYIHLFQFVVVIAVLAAINLTTHSREPWAAWVALAWGSGVLAHGLRVFDKVPFLTAEWEKRHAERYLGRPL
jgi:transcriptional regulator with XRE-family HTH domain